MLQFVLSCFCSPEQSATISRTFTATLFEYIPKVIDETTLNGRIKLERNRLQLTQKQLAEFCNVTESAINNYERGTCEPSREVLLKLITILDKDYIIYDDYLKFLISDYIGAIKLWRKENNLSQRAASKILGLNKNSVNSWETKEYCISRKTYYKIKNKLEEIIKGRV